MFELPTYKNLLDCLTVIIVVYRPDRSVQSAIRCALDMNPSNLIVWDNTDCEHPVNWQIPGDKIRYLGDGINYGFGGAINRAILSVPETRYLLLLNPDCYVSPPAIASLVSRLDSDNGLCAAVPKMSRPDGSVGIAGGAWPVFAKEFAVSYLGWVSLPRSLRSFMYRILDCTSTGKGYSSNFQRVRGVSRVDWISGFCMLCRFETFKSVDGMDESYFMYFEDVDLCRRFKRRGLAVCIDLSVEALHRESETANLVGKRTLYRHGMYVYFSRYGGPIVRAIAKRKLGEN